jgi:hypothetical protein
MKPKLLPEIIGKNATKSIERGTRLSQDLIDG